MSRLTRVVVLAAALASLFAALTSAAGAATWDNSGSTSFTATGGPATLSVGSVMVPWTSADLTGVSPTSSTTGDLATGTTTLTNCSLGGALCHGACTYTLTAASQSGGVSSGTVDVTCDLFVFGVAACHVAGTTPGSYTNPVGTTKGKLTLAHSSGTLRVFNPGNGGVCPLGNNVGATLTTHTYSITAANGAGLGPAFTRTP